MRVSVQSRFRSWWPIVLLSGFAAAMFWQPAATALETAVQEAEGAPEIDPAAVDWSQVEAESLTYRFRQDPGPRNSLGRIKFMFPNKFDVYLHDTPERGLFSRAARDFSSGCIRVEKPLELAEYLLRDDPDWTRERILVAIDAEETQVVSLRKPLNVHILYWTAWLAEDGRAQFRQDIYLRDAALYRALEERASTSGW